MLTADLVATVPLDHAGEVVIPGDRAVVEVVVTNQGGDPAIGKIDIDLYASLGDIVLDGDDTLLASLTGQAVKLAPGQSKTYKARVTVPAGGPAGDYYLLADVDTGGAIPDADPGNNVGAGDASLELAYRFGTFAERKNARLVVTDDDGSAVSFSLTGGGYGELTENGDSYDVTLTQTGVGSSLKISVKGGDGEAEIHDVIVAGSLKGISGKGVDLTGSITVAGTIASIVLDDIADDHTITILGDGVPLSLTADVIGDLRIDTVGDVKSIRAAQWNGPGGPTNAISARSLGSLMVKGDKRRGFAGDFGPWVLLGAAGGSGQVLGSAKVAGTITGDLWSLRGSAGAISAGAISPDWNANITGGLGALTTKGDFNGMLAATSLGSGKVGGNANGARLFIGADLGDDAALGGSGDAADTFGPGILSKLQVRGEGSSLMIAAGLDPGNGIIGDGDDSIIGSGSTSVIGKLSIGGPAGNDSFFAAAAFGGTASMNRAKVDVSIDPRFFFGGISVDSLSSTDAQPAALVTVTGTGFDPDADTWAWFQDGAGYAWPVPVIDIGPTSMTIPVPPYVDPASGAVTDGTVSVHVVQETAAGRSSSALLPGFHIQDMPTPPGPAGSTVLGFLRGTAAAAEAMRDDLVGTRAATPAMMNALTNQADQFNTLAGQVEAVVQNPAESFSMGSIAGQPVVIDAAGLQELDRMLLAMCNSLVAELPVDPPVAPLGELPWIPPVMPGPGHRGFAPAAVGFSSGSGSDDTLAGRATLLQRRADQGDPGLNQYVNRMIYTPYPSSSGLPRDIAGSFTTAMNVVQGAGGVALAGLGLLALATGTAPLAAMGLALGSAALLYPMIVTGGGLVGLGGALEQVTDEAKDIVKAGQTMLEKAMASIVKKFTIEQTLGKVAATVYGGYSAAKDIIGEFTTADFTPLPPAGIIVSPVSGLVTSEAGGTASFTVKLDTQPTGNVTIGLSSSDTQEGRIGSSSLRFTNKNWAAPQTVTITGVNDGVGDGDAVYSIITSPAVSTDLSYNGMNGADVSVTNKENIVNWYVTGSFSGAGRTYDVAGNVSIPETGGSGSFSSGIVAVTVSVAGNKLTVSGSGFGTEYGGSGSGSGSGSGTIGSGPGGYSAGGGIKGSALVIFDNGGKRRFSITGSFLALAPPAV